MINIFPLPIHCRSHLNANVIQNMVESGSFDTPEQHILRHVITQETVI